MLSEPENVLRRLGQGGRAAELPGIHACGISKEDRIDPPMGLGVSISKVEGAGVAVKNGG